MKQLMIVTMKMRRRVAACVIVVVWLCGCVVVSLCRCVDEAERKSGCFCGFSKQAWRFNNIVDKL